MITHNLLQLLKKAVLPEEYATAHPKRLRFVVFTAMGRITRHAGRVLLRIAQRVLETLIAPGQKEDSSLEPKPGVAPRRRLRRRQLGGCGARAIPKYRTPVPLIVSIRADAPVLRASDGSLRGNHGPRNRPSGSGQAHDTPPPPRIHGLRALTFS